MIRTRFAPSPTGMLHIGGARTALFSWLYARHHGGEFVLRIEDTDRERSTAAATEVILEGMRWLGLDWDGEPVFQRQREPQHRAAVERLLAEGKAYRCNCSRERLDAMRAQQRASGHKPLYDGHCRSTPPADDGAPFVVRFRSPETGETWVRDQVLGDVCFANSEIDDLIIMRSDGSPTYNLAVVVDDAEMGITHVVRGADHLNNTPRQIQLYQALGLALPQFAHIPLIHGPDGAKMSKRHGAVAITDYRDGGCLPEAMINYLARMGWSHGDQELFNRQELIDLFDLAAIGKAAARFDQAKLDWLNAQHLRQLDAADLATRVAPLLQLDAATAQPPLAEVVGLLTERSGNLLQLADGARMFYQRPLEYQAKAVKKHCKAEVWPLVQCFVDQAAALPQWAPEEIHALIDTICQQSEVKMGKLAQPIRILISGAPVSPPIDTTLALLGREEALTRLRSGMQALANKEE
ncbi:MAG: glutamate--tRNA ligase [Mariprofundales bacterium]